MENHTAKHFVLQLGALASLYVTLSFLLVLLFGIINLAFPDAAEMSYATESSMSMVRLGIAMVVVFFPAYLILTRTVNRIRRQETSGMYLTLTKWLIYLSLLVGGAVLLGDLVAVLMMFLEGEITERFIFKALAVLVVIGTAFYYYLEDARNTWLTDESRSIYFGVAATVVAFGSVVYGFTLIDTPTDVREERLDERQISDLTTIQWEIDSYFAQNNNTLPDSLEELSRQSTMLPSAPEERTPYEYRRTAEGFALCATFGAPSKNDPYNYYYGDDSTGTFRNMWNWEHSEGMYCFERFLREPTDIATSTTSTTSTTSVPVPLPEVQNEMPVPMPVAPPARPDF